jgi:hypothetical protein
VKDQAGLTWQEWPKTVTRSGSMSSKRSGWRQPNRTGTGVRSVMTKFTGTWRRWERWAWDLGLIGVEFAAGQSGYSGSAS